MMKGELHHKTHFDVHGKALCGRTIITGAMYFTKNKKYVNCNNCLEELKITKTIEFTDDVGDFEELKNFQSCAEQKKR